MKPGSSCARTSLLGAFKADLAVRSRFSAECQHRSRLDPATTQAGAYWRRHTCFIAGMVTRTTVTDIAPELSVSSANVYRFFRSKRAIDELVAKNVFNEMVAAIIEADEPGSATQQLRALLLAIGSSFALQTSHEAALAETSSQTQYARAGRQPAITLTASFGGRSKP